MVGKRKVKSVKRNNSVFTYKYKLRFYSSALYFLTYTCYSLSSADFKDWVSGAIFPFTKVTGP